MANCTAQDTTDCTSGAGIAAIQDGLLDFTHVDMLGSAVEGQTVGFAVRGHTVVGQFDREGAPQDWTYWKVRSSDAGDTISDDNQHLTFASTGARTLTIVYDNGFDHLEYPIKVNTLAKDAVPGLPGDNSGTSTQTEQPPFFGIGVTGLEAGGVFIALTLAVVFAILFKRRRKRDEQRTA